MRQSAPGEKETAGGRKGEGNRMPTYREFREQVRRRKRKRAMRRALIFVVVVAAVLAAAYGAIRLLGEPSWLKGGDQTQSTPQSTSMTQSTPQGESTPESGSEAQSAAQSQQPASPSAEGTAAAWDTMQPLEKTLDQTVNSPDFRLLGLPEDVRARVSDGTLSAGHAKVLLGLPEPGLIRAAAQEVTERGLNVRQTEALCKKLAKPPRPPKPKPDAFTRPKRAVEVEAALKEVTGSEVHVEYKDGKGSLKIDFYSDEMLQKFVSLLGQYDPEA